MTEYQQGEPPVRADRLARVPWGAVAVYTVVAYGLAWLASLPLWTGDSTSPNAPLLATLMVSAAMFAPAVATLVVVFVLRTPRTRRARFLGLWPLRPAKRVVWFAIASLFAPIVLVALSTVVAWAFGWIELDLAGLSGFRELNEEALPAGMDPGVLPEPVTLILIQLISFPFVALIPNSILAFGEELGWRGWLLPALRPLGVWPSLLLSGAIWGLWHAPFTLLGHNYGLMDWRGVALMTVNCTVWGVAFGWLRLRSASVWPAVIAHGAINGSANMTLWFTAAGSTVEPALSMIVGVSGWIAFGILILALVLTGQLRREPELAPQLDANRPEAALPRGRANSEQPPRSTA